MFCRVDSRDFTVRRIVVIEPLQYGPHAGNLAGPLESESTAGDVDVSTSRTLFCPFTFSKSKLASLSYMCLLQNAAPERNEENLEHAPRWRVER